MAIRRCTSTNGGVRCVKTRGHSGAHVNGTTIWYSL